MLTLLIQFWIMPDMVRTLLIPASVTAITRSADLPVKVLQ
jgi:hypothetical protein